MAEVSNVVEIESVVNQLINPHRPHLRREAKDSQAWGRFLKQLGEGDHSHRLIQWVCAHPVYLIEIQNNAFRKKPVSLIELLRRENLVREDFIRTWMRFEASPRSSLLKHVEHQRLALQVACMMWFSPSITVAYDYQELFQSLCEFLQIVRELIETSRRLSLITEEMVIQVAAKMWDQPLGLPLRIDRQYSVKSVDGESYSPTIGDLLGQPQENFQRVIGRNMRLQVSAHLSHYGTQTVDDENMTAFWQKQLLGDVRSVIREWYAPVRREDTRLGAQSVREIYGDLFTYLSYRLIDHGVRAGLCL